MVNLTIGGGSFKGISYIGALEYLYKNELLNKIDNFYGTSVGSIIGILFIIGYKPYELFSIILNINFEEYWDFSFDNILKTYSLISDKLFIKINEIFKLKENINITFIDFYKKYNVNLNIFATSINNRKYVCFNKTDFPDLQVIKAIQASSSIPIIFPPVKINGSFYIDGCIKSIDGIFKKNIDTKNINFVIKGNNEFTNINGLSNYIIEVINSAIQNEDNIEETIYTININMLDEYYIKINFNDIKNSDKIKLYYHGILESQNKIYKNLSKIKLKINNEILNIIDDEKNSEEITNNKSTQTEFN